jgi:16S rRNA (guanine527-N7)-methyltransferase
MSLPDLAERWALDGAAVARLQTLVDLIAADPTAPTAIRDPEAIVGRHLADSLAGLEVPAVRQATTIADMGSGAGFPGLVLAIARPAAHVALVESGNRKRQFLERAVAAVGVQNAEVVHARVEEWRAGFGAHDVVTARALAPLPVLAEYAAPLLRIGGTLVAWKGAPEPNEVAAGEAAALQLGLRPETPLALPPTNARLRGHGL